MKSQLQANWPIAELAKDACKYKVQHEPLVARLQASEGKSRIYSMANNT